MNVVFGVEHNGDDFLSAETEKCAKVITVAVFELRTSHVGRVVDGMMIVVLQDFQNIVEMSSWDEDQTFPVMNHCVGTRNFAAIRQRIALLDLSFACRQRFVSALAGGFGKLVDPERILAALQFKVVA